MKNLPIIILAILMSGCGGGNLGTSTQSSTPPYGVESDKLGEVVPLSQAIKVVKGNGRNQFAIFVDPNCPHCKNFDTTVLSYMEDYTEYIFLMPFINDSSYVISRNIICSADPRKAYSDWMNYAILPQDADCPTHLSEIKNFAASRNISHTPTIVFSDGTTIVGEIDLTSMRENLKLH